MDGSGISTDLSEHPEVWNPKLQFIQKPMALVGSSLAQTRAKETSSEEMGGRVDNSWGTKLK